MAGRCKNPRCEPDLSCILGNIDKRECEHWQTDEVETANAAGMPEESISIPWKGMAAGIRDLAYIAARGCPCVIGLIGPHDAGKTTVLSVFYSELLRRGCLASRLCAGSYTFAGWESIAGYMRWAPNRPPTFPPHTSSFATREPGLLHLALRNGEQLEDVLYADAPGEWFTEWATAESSSAAEGARWIARQADLFLIIVDSEALCSRDKRGKARNQYQMLVERCASVAEGRPVVMVRAKSDVSIPDALDAFLRQRQQEFLPAAEWQQVSKDRPEDLFATVSAATQRALASRFRRRFEPLFPVLVPDDPFLGFRGNG
jgi:Double-GTPase 2